MRLPSKGSLIAGGMVLALVLSACSSSIDSMVEADTDALDVNLVGERSAGAPVVGDESDPGFRAVLEDDTPVVVLTQARDIKVIRDGRIDLRIGLGEFSQASAQLRTIAADLGGYVSSGESHLEEIEGEQYAVGWFTLRVPEPRFEDAMSKAEELGERIGLNVSSQEVSEEYVDLEGRLRYWETQEVFYLQLMEDATTTQELVSLQAQMQPILLTIEEIEGRLRYLDSRTQFSTLTVGLTEVPVAAPIETTSDPGIIEDALDQAGIVLLSMVAFLIVAAAFALPIGIVAAIVYAVWRGISGGRKESEPVSEPVEA